MIDLHAAMAADGHEELLFWQDAGGGLRAVVALHDTTLGPALGGVSLLAYAEPEQAVTDALRRARAATYANALAGLDFGGGAAVILAGPEQRGEPLLRAFGRRLAALGGRLIALADAGISADDLDEIARETRFVAGRMQPSSATGDHSAATSRTVYLGMLAAVQTALGAATLRNLTVAVQGAGKVGCQLIELLAADGAHVVVTDSDAERARRAASRFGARLVGVESIYDVDCDIFSPNALGGALNAGTIPRLRCRIVCGGASSQLDRAADAELLASRQILYVPDFAVNCGSAIIASEEWSDRAEAARAEARIDRVFTTCVQILAHAAQERVTPTAAAEHFAEQRLLALAGVRRTYAPEPHRPR